MKLSELVDLESQLLRDAEALRSGKGKGLLERDRALGQEVLTELALEPVEARNRLVLERGFRRRVGLCWLEKLRPKVAELPGRRLESGYRLVGWLLVFLGAMLGFGTANAVLAYDGTRPVNVFWFLAIFVGLQLFLLALMILAMATRRTLGASGLLGWVQSLIVRLSQARWVDRVLAWVWQKSSRIVGPAQEKSSRIMGLARGRHTLYARMEKWLLFALSQRFGVAFNVSALVTSLCLVAFTDLTFAWSTTLDLDAATLHRGFEALALPWSGLVEDGVPSLDVIDKSRWVRLKGEGFSREHKIEDAMAWAGDWWRFLVLCLVTWGLVPRLGAWLVGEWRCRAALRAVDLTHVEFQRLYERLIPAPSGWEAPAPEDVAAPAPQKRGRRALPPSAADEVARELTWAVAWGRMAARSDRIAALVTARFSWDVAGCLKAGGARIADDRDCLRRLAKEKPTRMVLVVEAGVQPTKEIMGFLRDARELLGARAHLVVGLATEEADAWVAPEQVEITLWSRHLETEGDPYLRLESLVPVP